LDIVQKVGVTALFQSQIATAQLGPALPASDFVSFLAFRATPAGADPGSAEQYTFAHQELGRLFAGWQEIVPRGQFATIHASHLGDAHSFFLRYMLPGLDIGEVGAIFNGVEDVGIAHYTDHVFGNTRWTPLLLQGEPIADLPNFLVRAGEITTLRDYRPGQHYVERWNRAPFGPALAQRGDTSPASRLGDTLTIAPSLYSDQATPARSAWALGPSARQTLFRDGEKLAEQFAFRDPLPPVQVPPGAATYRYEQEETRGPNPFGGPDMFDLSILVRAAWTFRSEHSDGATPAILPLPTARFLPELDDDNRTTRRVMVLPVAIERPAGAATPQIERVSVDISFDDGATWSSVPGALLGDRWFGLVIHAPGAGYASLRGAVRDVSGNASEVTIIHAYRLAPQTMN